MSLIRALLLLVILAGLAGLGLQNLSPEIPLVFLGLRSQPIPLTFLLLGAIAAGVVTGLVVLSLVAFSNYLTQRQLRSRVRELETTARSSPRAASTRAQANYYQTEMDSQPEPVDASGFRSSEAEPQPKTSDQSGTTYSYGYRDANQSGVGRRESIFDAEYREVTPPSGGRDQDWDDDDAFDWDDEPTGSRR